MRSTYRLVTFFAAALTASTALLAPAAASPAAKRSCPTFTNIQVSQSKPVLTPKVKDALNRCIAWTNHSGNYLIIIRTSTNPSPEDQAAAKKAVSWVKRHDGRAQVAADPFNDQEPGTLLMYIYPG